MNDIDRKIDIFYKELKTGEYESIADKSQRLAAFVQWTFENKVSLIKHPEFLTFLMDNASEISEELTRRHRERDGFLLNYLIGKSCHGRQDVKNTEHYCSNALDFFERLKKTAGKNFQKKAAIAHYYCGVSAYSLSRYDDASRHHYAALELMEELGDDSNACLCYNGLGFVFRNLKDYPKAMDNFQKAHEIAERVGKHDVKAIALNEIGNIYTLQGEFQKSMEYHQKALDITLENKNITSSFIYHDIAIMYVEMERYEDALTHFLKHYDLIFDSLNDREKSIITHNISTIYTELKDFENAERMARESLEYAKKADGIYEQSNAYEELSIIHAKQGAFEEAYGNLMTAHRLNKEVFSKDRMDLIQELQVKYESEARERKAEIYRLKNVELVEANRKLQESYDKLEKAQQEIIQLERQKSVWAMAVTANHEINQPLMVIRGNMDLLRLKIDQSVLTDKHAQYLTNIEKSIDRIGEILRKFKEQCPIRFTEYSTATEMVIFDKDDEHDGT